MAIPDAQTIDTTTTGTTTRPGEVLLSVFATNVSRFNVQFSGVSVSGSAFSLAQNGCTGSLTPLRTCGVGVQFSPNQNGQFNGTITFTDSAKGSPQAFPLYGVAKKIGK